MLDGVLIPVDFSEQCMMMVDCARELKDLGSRYLTIMHVAPKGKTLSQDENNKLDDMLAKLREVGIKVTLLIRYGNAVDMIVEEAEKEHVDMIAMAAWGKSRAEAFFVGSVSLV